MSTNTRQTVRELMVDTYGLGRRGADSGASASALTDDAHFGGHSGADEIEVGCRVLITSTHTVVTAATNASPIVVSATAHGLDTGDVVDVWGQATNTAANGRWTITKIDADSFSLDGSVGNGATGTGWVTSPTGAPADEQSRLSSKPALATGTMNLDPSLSTTTPGTFEILRKPLVFDAQDGPHSVHGALDEILRGYALLERRLVPITLVPDGDMLKDGTSDWSANNATIAAKFAMTLAHPARLLGVAASAAGGYASSGAIDVEPSKAYYFEVTGTVAQAGGSGTVQLYDNANSTTLTLGESAVTAMLPTIRANSVVMPSNATIVSVRLVSDANTDVMAWANVILRKEDAREFTLADRPIPPAYLGKLYATNKRDWGTRGDSMTEIPAKPAQLGSGLWQYRTQQSWPGYSLWYEEFIQHAALSSDTSTTTVIKEHLAALAAERLLEPLTTRRGDTHWDKMHRKAQRDAATIKPLYEDNRTITQPQKTYAAGTRGL